LSTVGTILAWGGGGGVNIEEQRHEQKLLTNVKANYPHTAALQPESSLSVVVSFIAHPLSSVNAFCPFYYFFVFHSKILCPMYKKSYIPPNLRFFISPLTAGVLTICVIMIYTNGLF
jgi:hypothetical protein